MPLLPSWRLGVDALRVFPLGVLVVGVTLSAQGSPEFDVASIKRNTGDTRAFDVHNFRDGQGSMTNVTLRSLLFRAFDITADTPIVGLPSWVDSDRYDVVVKSAARPDAAMQRAMWRAVLTDRLKLATHDDTREQAIFKLVLAKPNQGPGTGLTPTTLSCPVQNGPPPDIVAFVRQQFPPPGTAPPASDTAAASRPPLTPQMIDERLKTCGSFTAINTIVAGSMTMEGLAKYLSDQLGRLVVDQTGLRGSYAIRMIGDPNDSSSLVSTLQEQLGLKVESARAPARVLVIDHIERPTEN